MAVTDSIFGSKSEEKGFRSIEHTWGEDYVVYPQIPLSALYTPDPNRRDTTSFFFKTSVDYVLCTNEGRPILAIDSDGLAEGSIEMESTSKSKRRKTDCVNESSTSNSDFLSKTTFHTTSFHPRNSKFWVMKSN